MIKVGDRVRVVRIDPEDEATDLRTGDTGTVATYEVEGFLLINFDRMISVNGYDTVKYYKMREEQLEKVEDKPMTKSDLEDGMICIQRDGRKMMWLNGALRKSNAYCEGIRENLTHVAFKHLDIVKIHEPVGETIGDMLNHDYSQDEPIWERVEPRKMTHDEIRRELGYDFVEVPE